MQIKALGPEIPVMSVWQPGKADEVVTTERSQYLKFDKGTINIVYFHTHVHIEKMGNLSKSKVKSYICDNNLRSCAQFAPRGKCAPGCKFAPPNSHQLQRWSKFAPFLLCS